MTQTVPPDRETDPGDAGRDAVPEPDARDWRRTAAAVGSTVAGAAVDAVAVVGDAVRSLRPGSGSNGHPTTPRVPLSRLAGSGRRSRAADDLDPAEPSTPAAATAVDVPERASDVEDVTPTVDAAAQVFPAAVAAPAPERAPAVDRARSAGVSAPAARNGDAAVDRADVPWTETAWLPPLRERESTQRPWLVRAAWFAFATIAGLAAIFVAIAALLPRAVAYAADSADAELVLPEDTTFGVLDQRTKVYADDGTLMAILHGEQDRNPVPLRRLPDHVWQAVVAAEDQKYYEHEGYDPGGIARALVANVQAGGIEQGGSTVTQQVARLNFDEVGTARSLDRKFKEVVYAVALEQRFSKDEILDRYMNQVYFGSGAYGIQAASEEFFDANARELTVDQAALLAALISSPSAYNPRSNPETALVQRNLVLDSMADVGYISDAEAARLRRAPLEVAPPSDGTNREPSIIEAVIDEFKRNPLFGATVAEREDFLFTGGLEIRTTINLRLQNAAEEIVAEKYPYQPGEPTAVIGSIDPRSGAIKAAASAEEYNRENFNLALLGRKQPGSAAKPLVMAEALRQGFPPETTLEAPGTMAFPQRYGEPWEVSNFGSASFGRIDMRKATASSVNTYYAQLIQLVGLDPSIEMMDRMGIDTTAALGGPSQRGFSIVLGGWTHGATAIEMASAYGSFANNGVYNEPYLLAEVARGDEDLLQRQRRQRQVLEPGVNAVALDILRGPVSPGGTANVGLTGWELIGKTGTTNERKSAWFVGTTAKLSTAVWVAHPASERTLGSFATGGQVAAPIWQEYMTEAFTNVDPADFPEADQAEFVGKSVNVPQVRGLSEADALARLAEKKLIGRVQFQASAAAAGTVIWVSPSDTAQIGTEVWIGVSTGEPPPPPEPEPEPDDDPDPPSDDDDDGGGGGLGEEIRERIRDNIGPGNGDGDD